MNRFLLLFFLFIASPLSARIPQKLINIMRANAEQLAKTHQPGILGIIEKHLKKLKKENKKKLKKANNDEEYEAALSDFYQKRDQYFHEISHQINSYYIRSIREIEKQTEISEKLFQHYPNELVKIEIMRKYQHKNLDAQYDDITKKLDEIFKPYYDY